MSPSRSRIYAEDELRARAFLFEDRKAENRSLDDRLSGQVASSFRRRRLPVYRAIRKYPAGNMTASIGSQSEQFASSCNVAKQPGPSPILRRALRQFAANTQGDDDRLWIPPLTARLYQTAAHLLAP
jgi:hypothetical protein